MKFGELNDGTAFVLYSTWVYGNASVFIKALEDGDIHNAVLASDSSRTILVPDAAEVLTVEVINHNNGTNPIYKLRNPDGK